MSPSKDQSDITQLKIDVGIIKEQQSMGRDVMDRIEKKIDGMKYATVEDLAAVIKMLDEYKKEVKETYATKESVAPYIKVIIGLVALILAAVGGAVAKGVLK